MTVKVTKTGAWNRLVPKLVGLQPTLIDFADKWARRVSYQFLAYLKEQIENQTFQWQPLSVEYRMRKQAQGLDPRILIATGEYLQKLRVERFEAEGKIRYVVGAFPDDDHKPSGLPMSEIAAILEYGTETMPARPHFGPAWDQFEATLEEKFRSSFRSVLSNYWR